MRGRRFVLLVILSLAPSAPIAAKQDPPPSKPPVKLPDLHEIQDGRYGFIFQVPRNWEAQAALSDDVIHSFVGTNPGPAGMTLVLNKPLPGFLEGKKTWDDVLKAWAFLMNQQVQDYKLVRKEERACGKAPGLLFVTRHKQEGDEMATLTYMVAAPGSMIQVSWVSRAELFGPLEPIFDALCREFRLVDPATIKVAPPAPAPVITPGKPVETRVSLAAPKKSTLDAQWIRLGLDAAKVQPNLQLSADGKSLYALDKEGVLRKISIPGCTEEVRLALPGSAASLQRSKAGLLVAIPEANQAWLLDEATLAVKSRIDAPRIAEIAASPALATAYARMQNGELAIVDLQKGAVAKVLRPNDVWEAVQAKVKKPKDPKEYPALRDFRAPAVSPDGKWFFCLSGGPVRFAIKGGDLSCEEIGPGVAAGTEPRIQISPDSSSVAILPCDGRPHEAHPKIGERGVYVYKVADLQKPVAAIPLRWDARSVAWDVSTKKLYGHDGEFQLIVYDASGAKEKEYPLSAAMDLARQIVVHPEGKKMAVLTTQRLLWVELGAAGPKESVKGTPLRRRLGSEAGTDILTVELGDGFFKVLPTMEWSSDGRFVHTLEEKGTLRRIHVPEFVEAGRVELGQPCARLLRSKEGLVVHAHKSGELWLLDEATLAVKSKIAAAGWYPATSPALSVAYLARGTDFQVVDLKKGAVAKTLGAPELWKPFGDRILKSEETGAPFELQAMGASPDGKTLAVIQDFRLTSFAIQGTELTYKDMGPRFVRNPLTHVVFSGDSKLVAAPSATSTPPPGHPPLGPGGGTYLYALSDLRKPAVAVACESQPWVLGMDPATGVIYCGTQYVSLGSFSPQGAKQKEFRAILQGKAEQLLVHPDGGVLLLAGGRLVWVEMR